MKVGVCQLTSSDSPAENAERAVAAVKEAVDLGAEFVCTPEVTNCVSQSRQHQSIVLVEEERDLTLAAMSKVARDKSVWISLGSIAVRTDDPHGRFANRSLLIDPNGKIAARYDKIHMFDVQVSPTETYRESSGYRAGQQAVVAPLAGHRVGMTICYDVRFPHLYRRLARSGAEILLVPSAFSPVTGAAHWEALLRARAIETGCFVVAAAQTGTHHASEGPKRKTYGHSLVVSPWGKILLDMGIDTGVAVVDLDLDEVQTSRDRIPSLTAKSDFVGPDV